ncbi:MAG: hypothetical protein WAK26_08000 [Terracidiphilus sp.]
MKVALVALLFAASAFAQNPSVVATAACGPKDAGFIAGLDRSQHSIVQPEPGKARVYFIQEAGVKVVFWMDGAWVGANKTNSYFSVTVEPGEHHVCTNVQSILGHPVGLAHFTAEAGKIYYISARVLIAPKYAAYLFLGAEDSDQAKYQIASFPMSVSTPKK